MALSPMQESVWLNTFLAPTRDGNGSTPNGSGSSLGHNHRLDAIGANVLKKSLQGRPLGVFG